MNPTLKGMKKMIEAKEKAYALAKKEYYPDFNLRFAYGQRDKAPEGMKRRDMLTGMVEINIPIFYKSKQDRKVAEAKADIQLAEAQYRAMKNEISFHDCRHGLDDPAERKTDRALQDGDHSPGKPSDRFGLERLPGEQGRFHDPLDSRMTLYKYELEYHQALTEYEKNVASLGAAIGKELFERREENETI